MAERIFSLDDVYGTTSAQPKTFSLDEVYGSPSNRSEPTRTPPALPQETPSPAIRSTQIPDPVIPADSTQSPFGVNGLVTRPSTRGGDATPMMPQDSPAPMGLGVQMGDRNARAAQAMIEQRVRTLNDLRAQMGRPGVSPSSLEIMQGQAAQLEAEIADLQSKLSEGAALTGPGSMRPPEADIRQQAAQFPRAVGPAGSPGPTAAPAPQPAPATGLGTAAYSGPDMLPVMSAMPFPIVGEGLRNVTQPRPEVVDRSLEARNEALGQTEGRPLQPVSEGLGAALLPPSRAGAISQTAEQLVPDNPDNPEGTALGRAWTRGILRARSTLPALQFSLGVRSFNDAAIGPEGILADIYQGITGSPPEGRSFTDPQEMIIYLYEQGFPASSVETVLQDFDTRIVYARGAEADPEYRQWLEERAVQHQALIDRASDIPFSPAGQRLQRLFAEDDDTWGATLSTIAANPLDFTIFMSEVAAESLPVLAATTAVTVATRSPAAGVAALTAGSMAQEYGSSFNEMLQENNVSLETPADARAALENPELIADANRRGLLRSLVISAAEALGQGVAARALFKSELGDAVFNTFVQALTGGGGEAAARVVTGQEFSPREVIMEALAEAITAPIEWGNAVYAGERDRRNQDRLGGGPAGGPRLTPEEQANPVVPNDVMETGLAALDAIESGQPLPPKSGLGTAAQTVEAPAPVNVPTGAVDLDVLYGPAGGPAPETPAAETPSAPEAPTTGTTTTTAPAEAPVTAPAQESRPVNPDRVTTIDTPDNDPVDVETMVVEADSLLTSDQEGYPPELQPRDRDRAASQAQIERIANQPNPRRLDQSPETDRGSPITGMDGRVIESGNGRVIGLRRAYERGTAEEYRAYVQERYPEAAGMKNPVIIRRRVTDVASNFTTASNTPATLAMSASENARSDASLIDRSVIDLYRGGGMSSTSNRDMIRAFIGKLPQTAQGALVTKEGGLTVEGQRRFQTALFYRAYGDEKLLSRMSESLNDDIKSITGAMTEAAGRVVQLKAAIEAGEVDPSMDITPQIISAAQNIADFRTRDEDLKGARAQIDAFATPLDPIAELVQDAFFNPAGTRMVSKGRMQEFLEAYVDEAMKERIDQGNLPGVEPKPIRTPQEIVNEITADEEAAAPSLFGGGAGGGRPGNAQGGQAAQRPGNDGGRPQAGPETAPEETGTEPVTPPAPAPQPPEAPAPAPTPPKAEKPAPAPAQRPAAPRPAAKPAVKQPLLSPEKQAEADDLAAQIDEALRTQLNAGLDPKIFMLTVRLGELYVEGGLRRFREYAISIADKLKRPLAELSRMLRDSYNSIRGEMEVQGESIADMDDDRAVMQEMARLIREEKEAAEAQPEPDPEPEPEPEPMTPEAWRAAITDGFLAEFRKGVGFKTIVEARALVKDLTGTAYSPDMAKDLEEAIEVAVVLRARELVAEGNEAGQSEAEIYSDMMDLYESQPKLAQRTSTSMLMQAYSTPAPLAYLASRLGKAGPNKTTYEPTAGNGMLLMEANPAKVIANEMQAERVEGLRRVLGDKAKITEGDAMTHEPGSYSLLLTNPPFGKVRSDTGIVQTFTMGDGTTTEIDHAIVMKGLEGLPENGMAVLIIGGKKETDIDARKKAYQGEMTRRFYKQLYDGYWVSEHFTVDGRLYERQGAGWPVDVIVIAGKGKNATKPYPTKVPPPIYTTWQELGERLDGKNTLDPRRVDAGDRDGGDTAPGQTANAGKLPAGPRGQDQSDGPGGGAGDGGTASRPDGGAGGRPVRSPVAGTGGGADVGGVRDPAGTSGSVQPDVADPARPDQTGQEDGSGGGTEPGTGEADRVPGSGVPRPDLDRQNLEVETVFQVQYEPRSKATFAVGTLVPRNMQAAMSRALDALEARVGDIDAFVAKELGYTLDELLGSADQAVGGYFSAEQVDALALAIDNVSKGKGFIIGDQTGVGKGRFVAAMLRYAMLKGLTPVFITKDSALYSDMIRDMRDIGMPKIHESVMVTNPDLRGKDAVPLSSEPEDKLYSMTAKPLGKAMTTMQATGRLPDGQKMLFTTYSQMQQVKGRDTERMNAMRAVAGNAMFVLDESHEAGGGRPNDRADDDKVPRSAFIRELLQGAQGVVYSSATYAKNPYVMSLYSATDLALSVGSIDDLADMIVKGGVPLQQVISNMLVDSGQYARRERSYDGIKMDPEIYITDRALAERGAGVLRAILNLDIDVMEDVRKSFIDGMKQEAEAMADDLSTGSSGLKSQGFASVMHNVAAQFLLAIKVPSAIEEAIALFRDGKKPIIALSNTNASIMTEHMAAVGARVGEKFDLPFNVILERYLRRLRRVTRKIDKDTKEYIYLTDDDIIEHGGQQALDAFEEARQFVLNADLGGLAGSPIDAIMDGLRAAGINVGEITGRSMIIEDGIITKRESSGAGKKRVMNDYNSGALDALVINRSGSTGFSMHATNKPGNDGKPRHMIILQAEPNIDLFMQMLGRIHRTGQTQLPGFTIGISDLSVEKRPAAVLMRKMASLNANTTASKKGAVSLDNVTDFINQYGDIVVANFLRENPVYSAMVDIWPGDNNTDIASKFTGRLVSFPPDLVDEIYDEIETSYKDMIDNLDRMGMNALEAKVLELDAKTINQTELVPASDETSPFGRAAFIETVDVKKIGRSYTAEQVNEEVARALDGKSADAFVTEQTKTLRDAMPAQEQVLRDRLAAQEERLEKAETDKQKDKAQDAINRTIADIGAQQQRLMDITRMLGDLRPGRHGSITVQVSADEATTYSAVALGVDITKASRRPTAASAMTVRIAVADAAKEIRVPLSRLMGDMPDYRWNPSPAFTQSQIMRQFDLGQTESRETRQMITGNIPAGFAQLERGLITYYTDSDGNLKQGVLLPANFDAARAMADQPVRFPEISMVTEFLQGNPGSRVVTDEDNILRVSFMQSGQFAVIVTAKGGNKYVKNRAVIALVGDFMKRQDKIWRKDMSRADLERVLKIYADNLGTEYETNVDKNEARAITGETLPDIPSRDGQERARFSKAKGPTDTATNLSKRAQREQLGGGLEVERPATPFDKIKARSIALNLKKEASKLGLPDIDVDVVEKLFGVLGDGTTIEADGAFFSGMITVALDTETSGVNPSAIGTLRHEVIHALRSSRLWSGSPYGLFRKAEWDALERWALGQTDLLAEQRREYGGMGLTEEQILEEVIAEGFARWVAGQKQTGFVRSAFERIMSLIEAFRSALRGEGFTTAESVLSKINAGAVGRRGQQMTAETAGGVRYMFAGERASRNLDKAGEGGRKIMLADAKKMEKNGATRDEIIAKTGWFKGADGKWRFEINDIGSAIKPDAMLELRGNFQADPWAVNTDYMAKLEDILDHPELYDAFPILGAKTIDVALDRRLKGPTRGAFYKATPLNRARITLNPSLTADEIRDVILHELQHSVQNIEGFQTGGNIEGGRSAALVAKTGLTPEQVYVRLAGEVEARNVQRRQDFTEGQRGQIPPWMTEDVAPDQQILESMGGPSMSISERAAEVRFAKAQRGANRVASAMVGQPVTSGVTMQTPVKHRKESFLRTVMTQPIDAAFRIPFMAVGGLDQYGRWNYGKAAEKVIRNLVVEQKMGFMSPLVERVRAGIVDRYGLPEEYVERDRRRGVDEAILTAEGKEHIDAIAKANLSVDELKTLQAIMTGEELPSATMENLSEPIRKAIDQMGLEAVELGLISRESYERNKGKYLHRVYAKGEEDVGSLEAMVRALGRSRRRRIVGDQFKGRGIFKEVAIERIFKDNEAFLGARRGKPQVGEMIRVLEVRSTSNIDPLTGMESPSGRMVRRVYLPADQQIPASIDNYDDRGTFEVRGENNGKVTLWRDFTKAERAKMGEILDARYTIAKTYQLMAHDLATGRFFADIAKNEQWATKKPPADAKVDENPERRGFLSRIFINTDLEWVKVPDAKIAKSQAARYGALAGMYVRADIWRDMEELRQLQSPFFYQKILTQWKLNKTARNPVVHMNNMMSNWMFMDMADVRTEDLFAGVASYIRGDADYQEAAQAGAFGADFVTSEIRDNVLQPLLQQIADEMRGGKGGLEGEFGKIGLVMDKIVGALKAVDGGMLRAYQLEDQLFRMALYLRRRKQGATIDEAAIEARDQFLNYDIRAPWINVARTTVLPFIGYTYRAIPKIAQTMAERPWKIAKYIIITQALNTLAYAVAPSDDDEEDERNSMREDQQGKTWIGVPFTDIGLPRMMRMPWLQDEMPVFLDVRRWIPAGDVFDLQGDIPSWLQVGGPLMIGMELYLNKTAFTGEEIFNPLTDTFSERMAARADYLWKSYMPSAVWIPNSWYQEQLLRAVMGDARQWNSNAPYDPGAALLNSFGVKLKPQDVETGFVSWQIEFDRINRELDAKERSLVRQFERNMIDERALDRAVDRINGQRDRLYERQMDIMPE